MAGHNTPLNHGLQSISRTVESVFYDVPQYGKRIKPCDYIPAK